MRKSPNKITNEKREITTNTREIENVNRPIMSKGIESARYLGASGVEHLLWLRS